MCSNANFQLLVAVSHDAIVVDGCSFFTPSYLAQCRALYNTVKKVPGQIDAATLAFYDECNYVNN